MDLLLKQLSLIVLFVAAGAHQVNAGPIMTFTGDSAIGPQGDTVGGWEFSLNSSVTIDGLGIWDDDSDGLDSSHDVGLWTLGGTLLASTTITNAAVAVANGAGPGRWLFENIDALLLGPGSYVLGANFYDQDTDRAALSTSAATITGINFVNARESYSSVLAFPGIVIGSEVNDGIFGANLRVAQTDIPISSTLSVFVIGLMGLIFSQQRKTGSVSIDH